MKTFIAIAATILVAGGAEALGLGNDNEGGAASATATNTNTSTTTVGGGAGSFSPKSESNSEANVGNGVGNFSPEAKQGQEQSQFQGQGQVAVGKVGQNVSSDDDVTVEGDDYEAAASSAATLVLGTCQSGASAQAMSFGAALGGPDDVCLLFTAAQVAQTQGNTELAAKLLSEAVDILKVRTNPVRRFLQGAPLIGKLM